MEPRKWASNERAVRTVETGVQGLRADTCLEKQWAAIRQRMPAYDLERKLKIL